MLALAFVFFFFFFPQGSCASYFEMDIQNFYQLTYQWFNLEVFY